MKYNESLTKELIRSSLLIMVTTGSVWTSWPIKTYRICQLKNLSTLQPDNSKVQANLTFRIPGITAMAFLISSSALSLAKEHLE